eukprot:11995669-Prorocentrum_lima.AAC.1
MNLGSCGKRDHIVNVEKLGRPPTKLLGKVTTSRRRTLAARSRGFLKGTITSRSCRDNGWP